MTVLNSSICVQILLLLSTACNILYNVQSVMSFYRVFLVMNADESLKEGREKWYEDIYLVLRVSLWTSVLARGTNNHAKVSVFKFMFTK